MAACELTIELTDPDVPRLGGDSVSGTVVVTCHDHAVCDGLEVSSLWRTHGRGNVDRGNVDSAMVFRGEWEGKREYRYPFSLKTAAWPPTYYGTYLNVGQFIQARARLSWSRDPTTEREVIVYATSAPEDLKPTVAVQKPMHWLFRWTIGIVLLGIVIALLGFALIFLLPLAGAVAAGYWFFRVFLPRRITGVVECTIEPMRLPPAGAIRGRLHFTPRKNVAVNGITWKLNCLEKCVSGSGSTKTTHQHEVFQAGQPLSETTQLVAGSPLTHEFQFTLPETAPVSLKFANNELVWSGELRIDIPNWPDWVHAYSLTVVPGSEPRLEGLVPTEPPPVAAAAISSGRDNGAPGSETAGWFQEVVEQVRQSRGDPDRMRTVLAAVQDQEFVIRAQIEGSLLRPLSAAGNEAGRWLSVRTANSGTEFSLLFPTSVPCPDGGTLYWNGAVRLMGYDDDLGRILLRAVAQS